MFDGKAEVLDREAFNSVTSVVAALNEGRVKVEAGFCVIFSSSKNQYFLLFHKDRAQEAFAALGISTETPPWCERFTAPLGGPGEEHIFEGKAALLDKEMHKSVGGALEALNSGAIT